MPNSHVRCTKCDFEAAIAHRPITLEYQLPDGGTLKTGRAFGWCKDCGGIRDTERRFDTTAIRLRIAELEGRPRSAAQRLGSALSRLLGGARDVEEDELTELKAELQLAQNRRSPPRCLACSGTETIAVSYGPDDVSTNFIHECGGRLRRIAPDPDSPRFFFQPQVISLDAEGRRL